MVLQEFNDMPIVCMNREAGYSIGASIGMVEDVDVNVDGVGVGWGKDLRIRFPLKKNLIFEGSVVTAFFFFFLYMNT
jgi:hypothetical protein